ncbi:serine/threonine-protein kinase [Pseudofrankia sp. DC12]|uniref:WD40 repeat domain-containing serine/threonine protein kinase n=1 Tax=Pseudofrankia sp. DC12 TaxID=683315 RepID=UPI0005F838DC|nr:serine/threonine-protein kinase [Pseudofrankia sp. DC12]
MTVPDGPGGEPLGDTDPRWVGPYLIRRRLGTGGMGTVYLARNPDGYLVAVKVIHTPSGPGARARLAREVAYARRVPRFYTAAVLDAVVEATPPYYVTDYIPGATLADAVRTTGPLPPLEVLGLAVNVAAALSAIHGAGLIHRDLKPSNVILSPSGPRVIDFGISRATDTDVTRLTVEGARVGSLPFMAPEQADALPITSAVDVFAWGGLVLYAATGRYPFGRATTAEDLIEKILFEPVDLTGIDAPLAAVVAAAMAKDPTRRPSATDLHHTLVDLPAAHQLPAGPVTHDEPPQHPGPAALTPLWPDPPAPPRHRPSRGRAALAAATLTAGVLAVVLTLTLTRPHRADPQRSRVVAGTPTSQTTTPGPDVSLSPLTSAKPLATLKAPGAITAVRYLPGAPALLVASTGGSARLVDIHDPAHPLTLGYLPGPPTLAAVFTPDGRTLATTDSGTVRLWDVSDPTHPTLTASMPDTADHHIAISDDGKILAAGNNAGRVSLWNITNAATLTPNGALQFPGRAVTGLAYDSRADDFLITVPDGMQLRHADTFTIDTSDAATTGHPTSIAMAADGTRAIAAQDDGTVFLWNIADPAHLTASGIAVVAPAGTAIALSHDGTLAAIAAGPDLYLIHIDDPKAPTDAGAFATAGAPVTDLAISADATTIATGSTDGTVALWHRPT